MVDFYDDPAQMEPLLIGESRPAYRALIGLVHDLSEASACLDAAIAPATARSLAALVQGMNCYYSNLIEGHKTLPVDIDRALREPPGSGNHGDGQRALQNLAAAHIAADRRARELPLRADTLRAFLLDVHRTFCTRLPDELLKLSDGSLLVPGVFRQCEVRVGRHLAPRADTLESFLARYIQVYGQALERAVQGGLPRLEGILAAFAAHHRLAWIHPFADGNGRVARIALDAMLRAGGLNGAGLWSISRGFAKAAEAYKAHLAGADEARHSDLDGRGSLTERGLAAFCDFALRAAIDQARYMASLFALETFHARVEGYFRAVRYTDMKPEAAHLYLHAFRMGAFERGEAARITGLPERSARNILSQLVREGFLLSDTPKGKVYAGFPAHALGSLLPNLYPAGDVDVLVGFGQR